jgi:hypothetical protein
VCHLPNAGCGGHSNENPQHSDNYDHSYRLDHFFSKRAIRTERPTARDQQSQGLIAPAPVCYIGDAKVSETSPHYRHPPPVCQAFRLRRDQANAKFEVGWGL